MKINTSTLQEKCPPPFHVWYAVFLSIEYNFFPCHNGADFDIERELKSVTGEAVSFDSVTELDEGTMAVSDCINEVEAEMKFDHATANV